MNDDKHHIFINNNQELSFYEKGLYHHKSNFLEKAITYYTKAIELNENLISAYGNRGIIYFMKNEYDKAINDFTKAIELDKKYNFFDLNYNNRGNLYLRLNEYDKAINDFTKVINLDNKNATAYSLRGVAYTKEEEYDKAINDFTKAIELYNNDNATPDFLTGVVNFNKNEDVDVYYNRGITYFKKKEYDKAIIDYTKVIKLNEKYTSAYLNRGSSYFNIQKYHKAINDFTKAIKLNEKFTNAYFYRGSTYLEIKEYDKALVDYSMYLYLCIENNNIHLTHFYLNFLEKTSKYSLIIIKETFNVDTNSLILTYFSKSEETLKSFVLLIKYLKLLKNERLIAILYYYLEGQVASYKMFDEVLDFDDIPLSSQELYYYAKSSFFVNFEKNTIILNCINECPKENAIDYYYLAQLHLLNNNLKQAKRYFIKSSDFYFSIVMLTTLTSGKEQKKYIASLKKFKKNYLKINNSIQPFQNLHTQFNPYFHFFECENVFYFLNIEHGFSYKIFSPIWKEFSFEEHIYNRVELIISEILAKEVIEELIKNINVKPTIVLPTMVNKTENIAKDIYFRVLEYANKKPDRIEGYLANEIYEFNFKNFDFYFLLILDMNLKKLLNTEQLFYLTFYLLNKIENLKDEKIDKIGQNIIEFFVKLSGLSVVSTFFKSIINVKTAISIIKDVNSVIPMFNDYNTFKEEFWKRINYDLEILNKDKFKEKYSLFTYLSIIENKYYA